MAPAPVRRYIGYPDPVEDSGPPLKKEPDSNPPMRGLSLVIGATLISNFEFLQKFLWNNAGFNQIRDMPGLDKHNSIFVPTVIPLAEDEESKKTLDIGPELSTPKPQDLNGRFTSIADYHAAYKSGKVTPLQVTRTILGLIHRDQTPPGRYENAWTDSHGRSDLALAAARASTERWAKGAPLGILDGVPVGVKDDIDVTGYVTHRGMRYNAAQPVFAPATHTVWCVRQLEEAGAVVVGKNNMHELGSDTSGCNTSWGTPTNHAAPGYYPGGSSSGAGSALGGGVVPVAVGTDSGGSVRVPPSFNGVFGLKPTHHRCGVANNTMHVTGPMAATAADLAIAYRVMSRADPADPIQSQMAVSVPRPPPPAGQRRPLGIYKDWWAFADPRVVAACDAAVDHLVAAGGYERVDIAFPHLREAQLAHAAVNLTEMAEAARTRTANRRDWLSLVGPANKVLLPVGAQTPAADLLKFMQLREASMQHAAWLFREHPGLLVVTPTTPLPGWPRQPGDERHGFSDANRSIENMAYVFLANSLGCPAVTCPAGYVEPEAGGGRVPVGIMAMAEWGEEEQLLGWAAEVEAYLHGEQGGRYRPEGWADVLGLAAEQKTEPEEAGEAAGGK